MSYQYRNNAFWKLSIWFNMFMNAHHVGQWEQCCCYGSTQWMAGLCSREVAFSSWCMQVWYFGDLPLAWLQGSVRKCAAGGESLPVMQQRAVSGDGCIFVVFDQVILKTWESIWSMTCCHKVVHGHPIIRCMGKNEKYHGSFNTVIRCLFIDIVDNSLASFTDLIIDGGSQWQQAKQDSPDVVFQLLMGHPEVSPG